MHQNLRKTVEKLEEKLEENPRKRKPPLLLLEFRTSEPAHAAPCAADIMHMHNREMHNAQCTTRDSGGFEHPEDIEIDRRDAKR